MNFQFFLTKDCNLNCSYCFEGQKVTNHMSEKKFSDYHKPSYTHMAFIVILYIGILMLVSWCLGAKMDEMGVC